MGGRLEGLGTQVATGNGGASDRGPPRRKRKVALARYARNRRLADACYLGAFASLTASPGARAFYGPWDV